MNFRLWFPQLDVYDTIRRMSILVNRWNGASLSVERLYILDFYFANAPLLHETNMPQNTRRNFNQLKIEKPQKSFVSYPSAPILFNRMEPVQREAIRTLTGKGLLDREAIESGSVLTSQPGRKLFESTIAELVTEEERNVADFLLNDFGKIDEEFIAGFRRRTGLRRLN